MPVSCDIKISFDAGNWLAVYDKLRCCKNSNSKTPRIGIKFSPQLLFIKQNRTGAFVEQEFELFYFYCSNVDHSSVPGIMLEISIESRNFNTGVSLDLFSECNGPTSVTEVLI